MWAGPGAAEKKRGEMPGRSDMRVWTLGAVLLLAGLIAACGGNSTAVGVIVTAPGVTTGSTATVIANGTLQFAATVTGASATTVYWRVCKPAATPTIQPTNCTSIPGVTQTSVTPLTGYGTITQTGLYTAPPAPPDPNTFVVLAISTISTHINDTTGTVNTEFGIANVQIDTGVRVQVFPTTATIGAGQHISFTVSVTGTTVQTVNWFVNGIAGGNATVGFICPNSLAPAGCAAGEFFAPASGGSAATITAASTADSSKFGTANVTISTTADATVTALDPSIAEQGSAQQDVYVIGSNFFSNDQVSVVPAGQAAAFVPTTFISTTLLRATIPASLLATAGQDQISVIRQNGSSNAPGPLALSVNAVRPAIVASSPDSVSQTSASVSLALTGGFFSSAASSVLFNGGAVVPSVQSSRQLTVPIPAGAFAVPGLYPVVVQNAGIGSGLPFMSAVNIAVTPSQLNIPTASATNIGVGSSPSAVAIDYVLGIAVVANTGANTVSLINLQTTTPSLIGTAIAVGASPTGVAIDDLLHIAVVVNSGDQTVWTIALSGTPHVVGSPFSVAIGPTTGSAAGTAPVPFSIGINSLTHRAVVAYQSFNEATILDISTGTPALVQQIGGDPTAPVGTGTNPAVAVDERLNWAIITPGGGGAQTTTVIDLGHNATTTDAVRSPEVVASLGLSTTGVGINSETHQVILTTPNAVNLTSFNLLDNTVNTITFMNNGVTVDQLGFSAAAANPLENVGIAVNAINSTATIVDLESGIVLQTVGNLGTSPQAVAVDPASNQALVVNQGSNNVSVVSLGPPLNPLQIVEASPALTFTGTAPVTLTVNGSFPTTPGSVSVRLDQVPVTTAIVTSTCGTGTPVVCRQLTATVPANMLGAARNYAVDVRNTGTGAVSNVTALTVVQPIAVGNAPVGVAIDTDRDLAVVTNSGSGSVSLVALSATTPVGVSQSPAGAVGTIGSPLSVGANPLGVAVIPRLGFALVANNGSNNASLIDLTEASVPQTVSPCGTGGFCTGPTAVAINQDTAQAVVTNAGILNDTAAPSSLSFGTITPPSATAFPGLASTSTDSDVDQNPVSVAVDPAPIVVNPGISYVGVGTASQSSTVEVIDVSTLTPQRVAGFENPVGMLFDSLNQVFLVANSLDNNIVILDPITLIQTPVRVGINPTALDYDIQTSTLVTSNFSSHTLSVLDYVCPPSVSGAACLTPQVRAVLGLGGSQQFSVAIDPKLNLAVVVDQVNNRILLVPLPH
jgi:DNA-binding beta-propeller fold protein YncE